MSQRRRVLIFAYFFPPRGGAGVQRIVKFAKYLPDEGWDPTIVTAKGDDYWMKDESLARELAGRVPVVRTPAFTGLAIFSRLAPRQAGSGHSPRSSVGAVRRLRGVSSWLLVPDSYVGWVPFARRAGEALLSREKFDALLTTSSPDSAHLIGLALSARARIPWVADFRDPWTRRLSFRPPTRWHRARHQALEREVLRRAALVTFTSGETREDYARRYPDIPAAKMAVVTNGYDEEDFAQLEEAQPPASRFEILHAGQLNPERPALPFLLALRSFLSAHPQAAGRVRARFIGPAYQGDLRAAEELGLSACVAFEPSRAHAGIVRAMRESHALLLMEQGSEAGGLILPGKIFEYLRAGRPILGLLPEGAAWNLITSLGAGRCCRVDDREGCARALGELFQGFERGLPPDSGVERERILPFERRQTARRLANLLNSCLSDA